MVPWIFLAVTIIGALFTLNAHLPQRRTGALIIPSFLGGWLTSELPLHHIAWQLVATVVFVWAGALEAWPGWAGLAITLVSWGALMANLQVARQADSVLEAALSAGLGHDYREHIDADLAARIDGTSPPPRRPLNPFRFGHPGVRVHRDIAYQEGGNDRHLLDVYTPAAGVEHAPVLLQIHGGGWTIGNKHEQALPLMHHLAQQGWVCVATNYRLSPKATWPDHLVDVKRALAWIRSEIGHYGGDPDFVVATGGSAGGHLTAMVGLTGNDPEYQPGFESIDTRVAAAVPFYGVYDFANHWKLQPQARMGNWIAKTVLKVDPVRDVESLRRASPMHRLNGDAPPFFIIHGSHDSLAAVEEARHFAWSLRALSAEPVVYAELPGAQHAFEVFHSERTSATVQAVDRFLAWNYSRYRAETSAGRDRSVSPSDASTRMAILTGANA
jgi:acetyl esterase/lipase